MAGTTRDGMRYQVSWWNGEWQECGKPGQTRDAVRKQVSVLVEQLLSSSAVIRMIEVRDANGLRVTEEVAGDLLPSDEQQNAVRRRARALTGLTEFLDLARAHAELPLSWHEYIRVNADMPDDADDETRRAAMEQIAEILGVDLVVDEKGFQADREFGNGGVTYAVSCETFAAAAESRARRERWHQEYLAESAAAGGEPS